MTTRFVPGYGFLQESSGGGATRFVPGYGFVIETSVAGPSTETGDLNKTLDDVTTDSSGTVGPQETGDLIATLDDVTGAATGTVVTPTSHGPSLWVWACAPAGNDISKISGESYTPLVGTENVHHADTLIATESLLDIPFPGVFSHYRSNITTGSGTNQDWIEINGVQGALLLSRSGTGRSQDVTNSDAVVQGDLVQANGSASGTQIIYSSKTILFTATGNHVTPLVGTETNDGKSCNASANTYMRPGGFIENNGGSQGATGLANSQVVLRAGGTIKKMFVKWGANANGSDVKVRLVINGANGNAFCTIGGGVTNNKDVASQEDTVVSGDKVCMMLESTGGSAVKIISWGFWIENAAGSFFDLFVFPGVDSGIGANVGVGIARASSATRSYFTFGSTGNSGSSLSASEADCKIVVDFDGFVTRPRARQHLCTYNNNSGRVGVRNVTQGVEIYAETGTGAGWPEDTSDTHLAVTSGDEVVGYVVDDGTGGTATFSSFGATFTVVVTETGDLSAGLDDVSVTSSGSVGPNEVGNLSATLDDATLSSDGTVETPAGAQTETGDLNTNLDDATGAATGTVVATPVCTYDALGLPGAFTIAAALDDAFERIGKDIRTIDLAAIASARRSIRLLLSDWNTDGILFWKVLAEQSHTLAVNETSFSLAPGAIDVIAAVLRRSNLDTPMGPASLEDWRSIPDKAVAKGFPRRFWVERVDVPPVMHCYPMSENATDQIVYDALAYFNDNSRLSAAVEVPERWNEAFVAGLAAKLAEKFAPDRLREKMQLYGGPGEMKGAYRRARTGDRERGDTIIGMARTRR